jgi:hypothetical protein
MDQTLALDMLVHSMDHNHMSQSNASTKVVFSRSQSAEMSVTIRRAGLRDEATVARLARLDSRAMLPGPWLIASIDNEPLAALSLSTGEVAADPFRHTDDLVDLLRARARHMWRPQHSRARRSRAIVFPAQTQHLHTN